MKELHEILLKAQTFVQTQQNKTICSLVRRLMRDYPAESAERTKIWDALYEGFEAWPKFSGSVFYPVVDLSTEAVPKLLAAGCSQREIASMQLTECDNTKNFWTGSYGALRRELLDFLIDWTKPCAES